MIEVYLCGVGEVHERLERALLRHIPAPIKILYTENGKPYIDGNPVYFSLSHSGERGLIAISDNPIGVDLEIYKDKSREAVIKRFTARERAEIASERDFLKHWTAREAYVKLHGLTLAKTWKHIEFCGGKLLLDGQPQGVKLQHYDFGFGIGAVCIEDKL